MLRSRSRDRSYDVGPRIAAGGMGEVYQGTILSTGQPVAIKRMLEHAAEDEDLLRLFLREMLVASTLEHHNVVEVLDVGRSEDELYLVMELVDGPTLAEVLEVLRQQGKQVPIEVALGIVTQVAQGLAHAHERALPDGTPLGIVHRDIAPENVLVARDGVAKLVDFGLAKLDGQTLTQPGVIRGRPRSLAPEQARGDDTDPRTDVFALGAILFELTSGKRLYPDEAVATLLWRVAAGDYESIRDRMPGADPDLVSIIERACAVAPDDRHRSVRQMERELSAFQASRELRVTNGAIAEVIADAWDEIVSSRRAAFPERGELEGKRLMLPADGLATVPGAAEDPPPDAQPERPAPRPPRRPQRPRPEGWDRVIPVPEAPARGHIQTDRSGLLWGIYGLLLLTLAVGAGFWVLKSGN